MNFVALIEYKSAESFIIAIKIVLFTKRLFSSFSCFISWNLYAFFTILIYAYMSIIVVNHNYYLDVLQAIFFFKYFITIPTIVCLCLFLEDVKNTKLNCFILKFNDIEFLEFYIKVSISIFCYVLWYKS